MVITPQVDRQTGQTYYVAIQRTQEGRLLIAEGYTLSDTWKSIAALYKANIRRRGHNDA